MSNMQLKVDIFCQIVDNFGDIGITWRLSKQISKTYGYSVRLWIDDAKAAQNIIPTLNPGLDKQRIEDIDILIWQAKPSEQLPDITLWQAPADIVIEAFACDIPQDYQALMPQHTNCWINLEYLSAEAWVEEFHLQSAIQAFNGLKKTFFFPGFNERTGGLIRNDNLTEDSDKKRCFNDFYQHKADNCLHISLFTYPHAPIHGLLEALASYPQAIVCHTPLTSITTQLSNFFKQAIQANQHYSSGQLTLATYPFLSQADYDALLQRCDLNFVRGEDSLVRAIWAQQCFIWLPYLQSEQTHLTKLEAFLKFYWGDRLEVLQQINRDWADGKVSVERVHALLDGLAEYQLIAKQRAQQQAQQTDLGFRLNQFIQQTIKSSRPA
jgi:uncharacterized repeat protein (TIGR03837 family)